MHLERGGKNQKARSDELFVLVMISQNVANVLAKETFDTLAKFLDPIDVRLGHPPSPVRRVGGTRLEWLDLFLYSEIPRDVGHQIANARKRLHRFDGHRLVKRDGVQSGHAHQLRNAVDLCRTGTALARFAIPSAGQVIGLLGLNVVHRVEHHHSLGDLGGKFRKCPAICVAPPDFENGRAHFISSMICFSSSGISGIVSRRTFIEPSASLRRTIFILPVAASLLGKSSRKCPPRLSCRSRAARVMASETVSRCFKSIAVCQPGLYSRCPYTAIVRERSESFFNPSRARTISSSRRTMPTMFCIISCRSCWTW